MIKITRGAVPPVVAAFHLRNKLAVDCVTQVTAAEREVELAIRFFTDPSNYAKNVKLTKKKFAFAIYKDAALAQQLEIVFHNKCAYCESRFAHVTPKDVEHFRPKSEIDTGARVLAPGYYWLAGTWDNLFVSCPDCNRARKHKVPNQPKRILLGKETQFPLSDERKRVRKSGSLDREETVRLLLNPCLDNPEQHLTFDNQGLIHPRKIKGKISRLGEISITVYALQRKLLVEERQRVLSDLRFLLDQLEHLADDYNELVTLHAAAASLKRKEEQIRQVKAKLEDMFRPDAPYLAMLRTWIRASRKRGDFAKLLQFGIDPRALL